MSKQNKSATVPAILITGTDPSAMASTTIALQWDLPRSVVLRHHIDPETGTLLRMVSDVGGIVDETQIDLEHACVSCAIREDVVPMLERLAEDGRWESIVAHLPVAAEAVQVCRVAAWNRRLTSRLRISAVVNAVVGEQIADDVRTDDLLIERGVHSTEDDHRGLAETACALVEHADLVVATGDLCDLGADYLTALARPGVPLARGTEELDALTLARGIHDHDATEAWVAEVRRAGIRVTETPQVWTEVLTSPMPFHPERLTDNIEELGGGPHRSRGCFWLPTRPRAVCAWGGAGGQLGIGTSGSWGSGAPLTQIVVTGSGPGRDRIREAFERSLVTEVEAVSHGLSWQTELDGLEPWLGSISPA